MCGMPQEGTEPSGDSLDLMAADLDVDDCVHIRTNSCVSSNKPPLNEKAITGAQWYGLYWLLSVA